MIGDNVPSFMAATGDASKIWWSRMAGDRLMTLPDGLKPSEALEFSRNFRDGEGMGYEVGKFPLYMAGVDTTGEPYAEESGAFGIARKHKDTGRPVGKMMATASDRLAIWNPSEMAAFGDRVAEAGGGNVTMDTMGYFGGGALNWMLFNIQNAAFEVVKGDKILPYIAFSNNYNKSAPLKASRTDVRVVCRNTLDHAITNAFRVRHVGDLQMKLDDIAEGIGLVLKQTAEDANLYREMAENRLTLAEFDDIVKVVIPGETDLAVEKQAALRRIYATSPTIAGMNGVEGTAWGGLNAFTQYIDHEVKARSDDRRFELSLFGAGADLKTEAMQQINLFIGKRQSGPQTFAI